MINRTIVTTQIPIDYILREGSNPKELFLLLHGYNQTANFMEKYFIDVLPKESTVLIPQGPYPLPKQFPLMNRKEGEDLFSGYGWYFFDPVSGKFPIDYNTPTSALKNLISSLKLDQMKITIIAYSQGAYLSLFCAEKIPQIKKIIGINGAWRWDRLEKIPQIEIHSINGENDPVVDPMKAKSGHDKLLEHGATGSFQIIKKEGHKLTPPFIENLKKLI